MNPLFVIASAIFAIVPIAVPSAFKEKKEPRIILKLGTLAPEGTTWVDSIKNIIYLAEETGSGEEFADAVVQYPSGEAGVVLDKKTTWLRASIRKIGSFQ
jgi:hypothetical protein